MKHQDIEDALQIRLQSVANCPPINYPNRDLDAARPILVFTHDVASRREAGINGGGEAQEGFAEVAILIDAGDFANSAMQWADIIIGHFPKALRLPLANGGQVVIQYAQVMGAGYRDGRDFRLPVRIAYRTG